MDKIERQYSDRMEYESIPEYQAKSLDYLLPEWITNLKNYFGKQPGSDYSHTSN